MRSARLHGLAPRGLGGPRAQLAGGEGRLEDGASGRRAPGARADAERARPASGARRGGRGLRWRALRSRFKPRGRRASANTSERTSWHAGAMSTSIDSPAPARDGEVGIVPDFFIVGHAKCGTTALYEMLRAHPQIFMPDLKEPAYFATDLRRRFQPAGAGPLPETLPRLPRVVRAGTGGPARRRGLLAVPVVARRRPPASPRCPRRRRSSRSCASPPASCDRSTCSCCRTTSRARRACAAPSSSSPSGAPGGASRGGPSDLRRCSTPSASSTSSSCAATTMRSEPSRCWC